MSDSDDMSDADKGRRERGLKMFNEVYGGIVPVPPADKQGPFFHQTIDQLFSETWSRPNLSIAQRRLVTLGAVAALGETEMFEIQLRAAIKKGELDKAQVEDLVLFLPAYIGYPRTSKILMISQKIFAEMEQATP
jgi:4-carboxymuconolactone decarboxylase